MIRGYCILGLSLMLLGGCIQVTPQPTPTPQGEVIFQDGFETGLEGWVLGVSPFFLLSENPYLGADLDLTTEAQASGNYSLKMTGGRGMRFYAGSSPFATAGRNLDYPGPSTIGLEVWFSLGPNVQYAAWGLIVGDGAYRCHAYLTYGNAGNCFGYLGADGRTKELDCDIELDDGEWHKVKMVIPPYATGYVWYMVDGYAYPFVGGRCEPFDTRYVSISAGVSPLQDPSEGGTFQDPGGTIILNSFMYIDDIIVTENEP